MIKVLVGAALILALAGCSGAAASEEPAHGESSSAEGGADGEVVGYPVGFPKEDVPLFDGTLLHFAHAGNIWAAFVESKDLVADLATASQLLLDAGYTQTLAADGYAEFTNPDRSLRVVAAVDATWGSCLMYTFTDGVTEADDAQQQDQEQQSHDAGGDH
ncbi:MAG: hypothetical protein BGO97_09680 [Micrococcales bacterium 70-64]|nr:hypothetical protein [Leifsonia sp.]ODU64272.1 MAG: hypothetical protein ABT06_09685 [Leifsonia sp. SCN 70-46]OJX85963.1 MAG: hypothetical protein BGO97_09680 [Micrococcales bacterium 70-64]